MLLVVRFMD